MSGRPRSRSDQWQIAATAFCTLTGEYPPEDVPPLRLLRPELPKSVSDVLSRALSPDPADRFHSVSAMLRELDRAVGSRTSMFVSGGVAAMRNSGDSEEARLRWATGEDYEVIARLGSGTFGSVWRVRDLTLSREVSLKMLHPHVSIDEQAVHRFRREAQLAAQLSHPAIVPIFDWDTNGGVSWYTMELAEGGSLADLVKRAGKRTVEQIAPQIDFVLDGLAAAHAAGIIHRDLKPENILIDRWRRWRIGDFGVAKISGEELLNTTTGTPEFAAPEQLLGEPQGPAVDCFEIAAITAFLLTGKPPFGTGDGRVILSRMLRMDVDLAGGAAGYRSMDQEGTRAAAGGPVLRRRRDGRGLARGGGRDARRQRTRAVVAPLAGRGRFRGGDVTRKNILQRNAVGAEGRLLARRAHRQHGARVGDDGHRRGRRTRRPRRRVRADRADAQEH